MSKRAARRMDDPLDFVPTPAAAVRPLADHLPPGTLFDEPCAGDGVGARPEAARRVCRVASDIEPRADGIVRRRLEDVEPQDVMAITNPPFRSRLLVPPTRLEPPGLSRGALLQPLDHLANLWMNPMRAHLAAPFTAIGRVRWCPRPATPKETAWVELARRAAGRSARARSPRGA